jgi:hypothetical protein
MGEGRKKALDARVAALAACVLCGVLCGLWSSPAHASSLAAGVQAYENMELDDAADKLAHALKKSSTKDKPRIELWLGIVELERGNEATARRWLRAALRANPTLTVEQELSPKILATIEAVRTQVTSSSPPSPPSTPAAAPPSSPPAVAPVVDEPAASVVSPAPVPPVAPAQPAVAPPSSAPPVAAGAPAVSVAPAADAPSAVASAPVAQTVAQDASLDDAPSTLLFVTAATGAGSAGALVGGAVLGTIARLGGEAAEREPVAAAATERYQDASTAAVAANGLFIAGGVAAVASAVCGVLMFVDGETQ